MTNAEEVLEFFENWYIKQYPREATEMLGAWIHGKAKELISDDPDYWAEVGCWRIYEEAKRVCPSVALESKEY